MIATSAPRWQRKRILTIVSSRSALPQQVQAEAHLPRSLLVTLGGRPPCRLSSRLPVKARSSIGVSGIFGCGSAVPTAASLQRDGKQATKDPSPIGHVAVRGFDVERGREHRVREARGASLGCPALASVLRHYDERARWTSNDESPCFVESCRIERQIALEVSDGYAGEPVPIPM